MTPHQPHALGDPSGGDGAVGEAVELGGGRVGWHPPYGGRLSGLRGGEEGGAGFDQDGLAAQVGGEGVGVEAGGAHPEAGAAVGSGAGDL